MHVINACRCKYACFFDTLYHYALMKKVETQDFASHKEGVQFSRVIIYMINSAILASIRVGGNDLCHVFGLRRSSYESIHKIGPISSIFSDIITVFGQNYVISGPVWEYYSGEHWEEGLKQELKEDRLNGFVGKTVIHPNQIETVRNAYLVNKKDYEDACAILNWDPSSHSLVHGNVEGARMNEYNTHSHWAQKILYLSEAYGVSDS